MLTDKKFRVPRIWSNNELKKFSHLFQGEIVNISGWIDIDKEGGRYQDYFQNASKYFISNYDSDKRGFQGNQDNEFFLNLEENITSNLKLKFDVIFNHTVLEHIFEINTAFKNLCDMSKDIVIIVVPFLQEQHAEYGDYWRFTPLTLEKLFKKNNMEMIYLNYNDSQNSSIYLFSIGSRNKNKWKGILEHKDNKLKSINNIYVGTKLIKNSLIFKVWNKMKRHFKL